ncbi:MAG: AsmA family protein [Lentisphaerae bacterium]|nr:AsmA family protein [Lentisphaerota bacterium]
MKKALMILGITIAVILVVLIIGLGMYGGFTIKQTVNQLGPRLLGVPVTLQDAKFSPFKGKLVLKNLHVGNPEGFKTPSLFDLGLIDIDLNVKSLFTDTIEIREIIIEAPEITYERGLKSSNIDALTAKFDTPPADKDKVKEPTKEKKDGKKVVIKSLKITDGKVNVSFTALGGHAMTLPLPSIHLTGIGEEKDASFLDAITEIIAEIGKSVIGLVTSSGKFAVDGLKSAGSLITEGLKSTGNLVTGTLKGAGGRAEDEAKNVSDKATEGSKVASDMAKDGAKAATDMASEGAKAVESGVEAAGKKAGSLFGMAKGLLGKDSDSKEEDKEEETSKEEQKQ